MQTEALKQVGDHPYYLYPYVHYVHGLCRAHEEDDSEVPGMSLELSLRSFLKAPEPKLKPAGPPHSPAPQPP